MGQLELTRACQLQKQVQSAGLRLAAAAGNSYSTFSSFRIETATGFAVATGFGASNSFVSNIIAPRSTPFPGTSTRPSAKHKPCHGAVLHVLGLASHVCQPHHDCFMGLELGLGLLGVFAAH